MPPLAMMEGVLAPYEAAFPFAVHVAAKRFGTPTTHRLAGVFHAT